MNVFASSAAQRVCSTLRLGLGFATLFALGACSSGEVEMDAEGGDGDASGGQGQGGADNASGGGSASGSGGRSTGGGVGTGGEGSNENPASKSAGCGSTSIDATGTWLPQTILERYYEIQLPEGYDAEKAYPVVYQFHGCSSNEKRENNNVPVAASSGNVAIIVRGRALADCWKAADDDAYSAAMIADVESRFCIDTARRFLSGYSSGAFYSHQLTCGEEDAARFRGVATIAGGGGGGCKGQIASLLIHDQSDDTVSFSSGVAARDRYVTQNGCNDAIAPVAADPAPCAEYQECIQGLPVVWCATDGEKHSRQDSLSGSASWAFFASLL